MFAWRGPFGLRGRIVGAVIVTAVAALAVAAASLLGPLEKDLRNADFKNFQKQVGASSAAPFVQIHDLDRILDLQVPASAAAGSGQELEEAGKAVRDELEQAERALYFRLNASEVALVGLADASGDGGQVIARYPWDAEIAEDDSLDDARRAFRTRTVIYSRASIDGSEYERAALPFTTTDATDGRDIDTIQTRWVLVIRRPFAEVNEAVHTVRIAFFDAALVALALTLLLAIPLSFTLVRRLRRLREAAANLGRDPSAEVPVDRARDEVGDLARSFALMQQQLEHQEEARRAFVATASHELRTPLTSLEGMLELLSDDLSQEYPDLEEARDLLGRARSQSRRLGRLAADLLDLSRIDAQVTLRSEPVELEELCRAVLAEFELRTADRGLELELHDAGQPLWALGDPGSVARILRILLDNALRVSAPGSCIAVELSAGARAALSVSDEGPGVPEDEREQIFERFHRGRHTSGQAGFGLGLAIGRELAERMGGELVLEAANGRGACFTLRLPTAAASDHDLLARY